MIRFGSMSYVLMLGALQGAVVVAGLLSKRSNRFPNRLLAALVMLLTLKLVPYIIGYAGFYDAYPWLDLAPFDMGMGIGPMLYLYICSITLPSMPKNWKIHLLPLLLQFGIYVCLFVQPLSYKVWFESHIGDAFNRTETLFVLTSMSSYLAAAWVRYGRYNNWLRNSYGDPDAHRIKNLSVMLSAFSLALLGFIGAKAWGLMFHPLSYFQMFPFYVVLTLSVYAFGFVAFRFAEIALPVTVEAASAKETDWKIEADRFTSRLRTSEFWRDPMISIADAAKALDTSESRLSKAINQGLGITFAEWINTHRVREVAARLGDPNEPLNILELSSEAGFNSKATFNRWFRQVEGCTPTEYRKRHAGRLAESPSTSYTNVPDGS